MNIHAKVVVHLAALLALTLADCASANTLSIDYFTIATNDPDVNHLGGGTVNNEVQNVLGPHGLPMLNTPAFGCASNCFSLTPFPTDLTTGGEITWWSPALNSHVTHTGSATVTLPFDVSSNFFPPNGTGASDANGFQAAILSGTLTVPSTEVVSFSIGADDSAFAYLDGQVVCDLGGVHPVSAGSCVTPFSIDAGNHEIKVFFADLNAVQSGLTFNVTTEGVSTNPVPEPRLAAILGAGLLVLLWVRRKVHSYPDGIH